MIYITEKKLESGILTLTRSDHKMGMFSLWEKKYEQKEEKTACRNINDYC